MSNEGDAGRASGAYVGRFAPSPTGPLHAGSVAAALASWLDARAAGGRWLLRIEDTDTTRCTTGAAEVILRQLAELGLIPDEPPCWQHTCAAAYRSALGTLVAQGHVYPCACTRRMIDDALLASGVARRRDGERIYRGTCRTGLHGGAPRAWRCLTTAADGSDAVIHWTDRRLGPQQQNVTRDVGDFVLQRADGLWAYQLAVVVDDAAQGITDVVRGEDLADNTPRQILLQRLLGLPAVRYLHTPLVRGADGHKLSKQNGAQAADTRDAVAALQAAGEALGLPRDLAQPRADAAEWRAAAVLAWRAIWPE